MMNKIFLIALFLMVTSNVLACEYMDSDTHLALTVNEPIDGSNVATSCSEVEISGSFVAEVERGPKDIYLILDSSSSMIGQVFADTVEASRIFVENLDPSLDRVALISFNTEAVVRESLTFDHAAVLFELDTMLSEGAGGGTSYNAALEMLLNERSLHGDETRYQRAVFVSDGHSITFSEVLEDLRGSGISVAVFGINTFGQQASIDSLRSIAEAGHGQMTILDSPEEILQELPEEAFHVIDDIFFQTFSGPGEGFLIDSGWIQPDYGTGLFSGKSRVGEGPNRVILNLRVQDVDGAEVSCEAFFNAYVPSEESLSPYLRVRKEVRGPSWFDFRAILDWSLARSDSPTFTLMKSQEGSSRLYPWISLSQEDYSLWYPLVDLMFFRVYEGECTD